MNLRWACTDDLKNYFKKSELLGGLTEQEKKLILINLGIKDSNDTKVFVEKITYQKLRELITEESLIPGLMYEIIDFQTSYYINDILYESDVESLIVTALSTKVIDDDAILLNHPTWEVKYNVFGENKGTITYLKDDHNNSAYYDFKNVMFERNGKRFYTFSYLLNGLVKDASETQFVHNNSLDFGCYNNVFIGETYYNKFEADCVGNTFKSGCNDCHFYWETVNNTFEERVVNLSGTIANKIINVGQDVMSTIITKTIHNTINNEYIISYLDLITYSYQIIII